FRFTKDEIAFLCDRLRITDPFTTVTRYTTSAHDAACIMLFRLAYPCRLRTMEQFFDRSISALSNIANDVIELVHSNFQHLLGWDHQRMDQRRLQQYADAICRKGSPLDCCIRFIDGTVRGIARPSKNQKVAYNGHKRKHALKYQSVV
ncbi:hypothetical protein DFJ73DRAFT_607327, partial [Zopfochytrium polystomum]